MDISTSMGPQFQEATKYHRGRPVPQAPGWAAPPDTYKTYEEYLERVALPEPLAGGGPGIWETIAGRRSRRRFSGEALNLQETSQLLWATQGITGDIQEIELRSAASAGALYPNETYVVAQSIDGVAEGVYHYDVRAHELGMLAEGDYSEDLAQACLGQTWMMNAGAVFVWGAVVARCAWKYQNRAYRYLYLDAGHLGAQLQLAAEGLGLGSCNIAAFFDDEVASLVGIDSRTEIAVYVTAVGRV
ncbi:MAG: SagB/ThcOx family dehydrogenase [Armatimonadota bacterium]|jgi:SagB-type dehydrogenase family enzyme